MLTDFLTQRKSIARPIAGLLTKAATSAIGLSSGLAPSSPAARAFLAQVDRVSPLGQIGGITVAGNITGAIQTGNATATWQGEETSKPIAALSFSAAALRPLKLTAQSVVSQELADLSTPAALPIVLRSLLSAQAAAEATALLDPTSTAIADVRPASVTAGLTPIVASGDLAANIGQVLAGISGGHPSRPVLVVSLSTAVRMQAAIRDLAGLGVRVVISSAVANRIVAIDADGLLVADGGIDIQRGTPALQLNDAPDSPPTASTTLVSLWQRNLVALKVESGGLIGRRGRARSRRSHWRDLMGKTMLGTSGTSSRLAPSRTPPPDDPDLRAILEWTAWFLDAHRATRQAGLDGEALRAAMAPIEVEAAARRTQLIFELNTRRGVR